MFVAECFKGTKTCREESCPSHQRRRRLLPTLVHSPVRVVSTGICRRKGGSSVSGEASDLGRSGTRGKALPPCHRSRRQVLLVEIVVHRLPAAARRAGSASPGRSRPWREGAWMPAWAEFSRPAFPSALSPAGLARPLPRAEALPP